MLFISSRKLFSVLRYSNFCMFVFPSVFPCQPLLQRLCIKPGIQERGTECGERGKQGNCYILGNVTKHSGECRQTFRGMLQNIPENVAKYFGECRQKFRGISSKIPWNAHNGLAFKFHGRAPKHGTQFYQIICFLQSILHRLKKVLK